MKNFTRITFLALIVSLVSMPVMAQETTGETQLSMAATSLGPAIQARHSFQLPTGFTVSGKLTLVEGACSLMTDGMGDVSATCDGLMDSMGEDDIQSVAVGLGYTNEMDSWDFSVSLNANYATVGGNGLNGSVEVQLCRDSICVFADYHDEFAGVEVIGGDLGDIHLGLGYRF